MGITSGETSGKAWMRVVASRKIQECVGTFAFRGLVIGRRGQETWMTVWHRGNMDVVEAHEEITT